MSNVTQREELKKKVDEMHQITENTPVTQLVEEVKELCRFDIKGAIEKGKKQVLKRQAYNKRKHNAEYVKNKAMVERVISKGTSEMERTDKINRALMGQAAKVDPVDISSIEKAEKGTERLLKNQMEYSIQDARRYKMNVKMRRKRKLEQIQHIVAKKSKMMEDGILLFFQHKLRTPLLTKIFRMISMTGDPAVMCLAQILLMSRKKTRYIGSVSIKALITSFCFNNLLLKNVFARTRPYEVVDGLQLITKKEKDYSFPSGHTANTFAVARAIAANVKWPFNFILMTYAFLMGLSRIYLGVHYPVDVIAGAFSGNTVGKIVGKKEKKKHDKDLF